MRCEQFRERLDSEPGTEFPGRLEHAAECADCARYAARSAMFERRLAAALAVDVPPFDIVLPDVGAGAAGQSNVVPMRERRRWSTPAWIGIAATVLIGMTLVLRLSSPPGEGLAPEALAAEVLSHMDHEPYSLAVTSTPVDERALDRVLRPAVSRLDSERVGLVTYARTCPIAGHDVPHLVVQGADGPVTLLLMPEQRIEAPVELDGNDFHGVILPVGEGSIAVIGRRGQSVRDVTASVASAVDWSI